LPQELTHAASRDANSLPIAARRRLLRVRGSRAIPSWTIDALAVVVSVASFSAAAQIVFSGRADGYYVFDGRSPGAQANAAAEPSTPNPVPAMNPPRFAPGSATREKAKPRRPVRMRVVG